MHSVLLLGAGKIGRMIARFLHSAGDYDVLVADANEQALAHLARQTPLATRVLDAADAAELAAAMAGRSIVVSALTYHHNALVAEVALACGASYFDLTEDIDTTTRVRQIAAAAGPRQIFMPQCGLAPGFVSIAAQHLTRSFSALDTVFMRVGALPQFPSNAMKYNLTWSTAGLVNEYCNPCEVIHHGQPLRVLPLEGLEHFSLDGVHYEAFNTSGGLGTLCETLAGRVRELNYKTVRYVGHRELMAFLVNELRLRERRELLVEILENAVPITFQDVVVIFCTASGRRKGQLVQISDARKIYMQPIDGEPWSAIQVTTGAGVCAAVDLYVAGRLPAGGFVRQEQVDLEDFLSNRFGRYFRTSAVTRFASDQFDVDALSHVD